MSKITSVTSPVQLTRTWTVFGNAEYRVEGFGVSLEISHDQYLDILVRQLPDDELVWHVNESASSAFFRNGYPEWSVVPNPRSEVAGNIYFATKDDATRALMRKLREEMDRNNRIATHKNAALQSIIGELEDATVPAMSAG